MHKIGTQNTKTLWTSLIKQVETKINKENLRNQLTNDKTTREVLVKCI